MKKLTLALLITLFVILESCGGGPTAGISGTGNTISYGSIDGFGSVYLNGVKFETEKATVLIDGMPSSEAHLRLGMIVKVYGNLNTDKITGNATRIEFNDQIQGPVKSITISPDNKTKTLEVLGLAIVIDKVSTHFEKISFETIATNDLVNVSGFLDSSNTLKGTRIKKKELFIEDSSEIKLQGPITNLTQTTFSLNALTVDFSSINTSMLTDNINVQVNGTLSGTTIVAKEIKIEDDDDDADQYENILIEGIISDFVDNSRFMINDRLVNASNAILLPSNLELKTDLRIKVIGTIVNDILVVQRLETREGTLNFAAPVKNVETAANQANSIKTIITLGFNTGDIDIMVNNQTAVDADDDDDQDLKTSNIKVGDFLQTRAILINNAIIATNINRTDDEDQFIQGPVEAFINNQSLNILGLTYTTGEDTSFDNDGNSLSAGAFYSSLMTGDTVTITDKQPADGVADEISNSAP